MTERIVNVSLRLDEDLHRRLMAWAKREDRSLHGQLVNVLRSAIDREEKRREPDTAE